MKEATANGYAKINLYLGITGVEAGYHRLDMVTASIDLADEVTLTPRRDREVVCTVAYDRALTQSEPLPADNTAVRTARRMMERFGTAGFTIFIKKRIPIAGGLGGSSADAAGVILAAATILGLDPAGREMTDIAAMSGADTTLQLSCGYKRAQGRGEIITALSGIPACHLVVAKGVNGVNTADSYAQFDRLAGSAVTADAEKLIAGLRTADYEKIAGNMRNDLYPASAILNPEIDRTLSRLRATGAAAVMMTGSGAACFGLYRDEKSALLAKNALSDMAYVWAGRTVVGVES